METETRADRLPPYVPYRTFINFIDSLKVGVPSHIDKSVMSTLSGGMQSWLISGLKAMKLVDASGVPSQALKNLAKAEGDGRKAALRSLFETTYSFLGNQGIDLAVTTPQKLDAVFEGLGAKGETVEKCVAFLRQMAKDAGIPLSHFLTNPPRRPRGSSPTRRRPESTDPQTPDDGDEDTGQAKGPAEMLIDILDPDSMDDSEQKAVWTLLLYLKKQTKG